MGKYQHNQQLRVQARRREEKAKMPSALDLERSYKQKQLEASAMQVDGADANSNSSSSSSSSSSSTPYYKLSVTDQRTTAARTAPSKARVTGKSWKPVMSKSSNSHVVKPKALKKSWKKKEQERAERAAMKELDRTTQAEVAVKRKEDARKREQRRKQKEENKKKSMVVQHINNPAKLKKLSRKQLRSIVKM
jgi:rRNA-processing protein CGR1